MSALPQLVYPEFCEEVAASPTPDPQQDDYLPTARVAPFMRLNSQLADGDYFPYMAWDGNQWERAVGQFFVGPPNRIERPTSEPTWIFGSSNAGNLVDWGAGATLNIAGASIGRRELESLHGDVQSTGLIARTAEHLYAPRQIVSAAEWLSVANAGGVAGNPSLGAVYDPLRRGAGGSDGQYTLSGKLILNILFQQFLGSVFGTRGPNGATDVALRHTKLADQSYLSELGIAGALKRILTIADIPQLIDLDFKPSSATGTDLTTLASDTSMTFATPDTSDSGETYAHVLIGMAQMKATIVGTPGTDCDASVFIRKGGTEVRRGRNYHLLLSAANFTYAPERAAPVIHAEAATPGVSATYDLQAVVGSGSELAPTGFATHFLIGACLRLT